MFIWPLLIAIPTHIFYVSEVQVISFSDSLSNAARNYNLINSIITSLAVLVAIGTAIAASIQSYKARKLQIKEINYHLLENRLDCRKYINELKPAQCSTTTFIKDVETIRCLFSSEVTTQLYELMKCGESYKDCELVESLDRASAYFPDDPDNYDKKSCIEKLPMMLSIEDNEKFLDNINDYFLNPSQIELYKNPENRKLISDYVSHKINAMKQMKQFSELRKKLLLSMQNETIISVKRQKIC